ncbi:RNB domain-containing ribonuclease [Planotetraspora sp. A-T 1434]|uniref:RNB domain-containing ribonuclease n=1 Tax=Planotetraspora sp. A-T 1434 TaxID=2979219 RepID=UPI0021C1ABC8|nr:RNB domain-containing ribonuclease [Planotetraspora sp. A-T 1434]MCT9934417.1 RNB domain-containing ribonuclease [Planotetraspora sp. A-T 1434]
MPHTTIRLAGQRRNTLTNGPANEPGEQPEDGTGTGTTGSRADGLLDGFARIRRDFDLPGGFPASVLEEAGQAAGAALTPGEDRTELPFVTIDPPGSMDLDQALCIEKRPDGYRVWYAIADVAAFVRPGGAVDLEARTRGETVYLPDSRVPLHPTVLSEGAASLLPGQTRPAALWCVDLDSDGETVGVDLRRAMVRSRDRLDYETVQAAVDTGTAEGTLKLLAEVGPLLLALERARGGVTLPTPEQEVVPDGDGYVVEFRASLPCEAWNAQISLLTGMSAAQLMLDAGVGVLRILPEAGPQDLAKVRRVAAALGVPWPDGASYGEVVHGLDPKIPGHAAFLHESTILLRGAAYASFNGSPPAHAAHAAVAAPYAHVTAPLRRLVDRYATEVCLAVAAGEPVPERVEEALVVLPEQMAVSGRRAAGVERACVDLVEAAVLRHRVGDLFDAVVIDVDEGKPGGQVQVTEPAVIARCDGDRLPLGERVRVRLTRAEPGTREVRFTLA